VEAAVSGAFRFWIGAGHERLSTTRGEPIAVGARPPGVAVAQLSRLVLR